MGRPPSVVRQMRGMKRNAVKGAGFFFSFVLGLVFYEIRKEKGRNGEDNKDNKMNRKWKRKKEMEKGKGKNDDQKWSVFQVLYKVQACSQQVWRVVATRLLSV